MQLSPRLDAGIIKSYQRTPEGYLNIYLTVSKVGSLSYQRVDGTIETEYLSQEELYSEDSLASLVGKPVTLGHPREWLSSNNVRNYIKGAISHKVIQDAPFLTVLATVHDAEAIRAIESGQAREVSAGYKARVVRDQNGKLYQRDREYNHVSLVSKGRAGASVRVHFDSIDVPQDMAVQVTDSNDPNLIEQVRLDIAKTQLSVSRQEYITRLRHDHRQTTSSGSLETVDEMNPRDKYIQRMRKKAKQR